MMEEVEAAARQRGCRWLHLSTTDKGAFYRHLGYSDSRPVSALVGGTLRTGQEALLQARRGRADESVAAADEKPAAAAAAALSPGASTPVSLFETAALPPPLPPPPPPPPPAPPLPPSFASPPTLAGSSPKHVTVQLEETVEWLAKAL